MRADPLRIGITGASGLVGSALAGALRGLGHRVHPLVRRAVRAGSDEIAWEPAGGEPDAALLAALAPLDAVVNLAGENLGAGRWTPERKRLILDSRVVGTRRLARALARLDDRPRALVQASAIGYYGDTGDATVDESAAPGEGFLAEVCQAWEAAAAEVTAGGHRLALARLGVVLTPAGGALARMLPPFRAGLGGPLGSGRQYLSWIHLDDTVGALSRLATGPDAPAGVFNLTAPGAVRQAEFARALGAALHRPAILPAPALALRLAFGEMAESMLLAGSRVEPVRLRALGFEFRFPELAGALRACLAPRARTSSSGETSL